MADFDIEAIRAEVRAMDYVRGTPAKVAEWRIAYEDSRHNHVIENMIPTPNDDAFWEMMLEEAVSPPLVSKILLKLTGHPNADPTLPITPMTAAGVESP
ncbi:hypothetical protein [Sphingobium sp. CECT 9361]|jgi:hypothetical protein|uniref:hypothetical protein n=1 Tax=Sphingobium sp. CECT 9361 TaxID=2845384 RepID=UPI001E3C8DCB|nr:hypothetical protein [Sphingobium sp. CECT 9361]CAH0357138.1 hypothetical protein SPH9361_04787 [Sphingobium sp. CECT 9361]